MSQYGHAYDLEAALDHLETNLVDRWEQTINDVIWAMEPMPPTLSRYKSTHASVFWDHRLPEIQAHITYGQNYGGCTAMNWYDGGRSGAVPLDCEGKIREAGDSDLDTVYWQGATVEVPEYTECRIGELFAAAEDWARADRDYIYNSLPLFEDQNLQTLEEARNALVEMAADFGAEPEEGGGDPAFKTGLSISDDVDTLFGDRESEEDWRADWTGTAADRVSEGIFASTKPTLINHAVLANGIATLINTRASIIHTTRSSTLGMIDDAVAALREKTTMTADLTKGWKAVQMAPKLLQKVLPKPASAAITVVGWLGEKLLGEIKKTEFRYGPGEAAIDLYDAVSELKGDLEESEQEYQQAVTDFRSALNEVPSTFLELQDITENAATGTH